MSQAPINRYQRLFVYEKDSHAKVLASLESVPLERRASPAFARAVTLLAHVAAARQLWLHRFGAGPKPPDDFFPKGLTLAEVATRLDAMHAAWTDYLDRLDDSSLVRIFEYQSLDGGKFRNSIEDILTQLFGHSLYHRGQIATLVREAGGEPAVTDFVYWAREAIAPIVP